MGWGAAQHRGSILASNPAAPGLILDVPRNFLLMLLRLKDSNAQDSGQRLDNVNPTRLRLASGKLVLHKRGRNYLVQSMDWTKTSESEPAQPPERMFLLNFSVQLAFLLTWKIGRVQFQRFTRNEDFNLDSSEFCSTQLKKILCQWDCLHYFLP